MMILSLDCDTPGVSMLFVMIKIESLLTIIYLDRVSLQPDPCMAMTGGIIHPYLDEKPCLYPITAVFGHDSPRS